MGENKPLPSRRSAETPSGRISYLEQGAGPVALFVHGVLLNGYLWRHQFAEFPDIRRCIAVDLLAHGDTEITPDQDVSVTANAEMLKEFLDALNIDQVDLVGNDSGGGIAQIFDRVMLLRRRKSRIYYMRLFFESPISFNWDALVKIGFWRACKMGLSYIRSALFPLKQQDAREQFLINRFGRELYRWFFKSYKVVYGKDLGRSVHSDQRRVGRPTH